MGGSLVAGASAECCPRRPVVGRMILPARTPAHLPRGDVGILMLQGLKNVDFDDLDQVVPVFLMLLAMPISGSIGHGIGIAMITYTVIKVFSGRAKEVSVLTYVISLLFIIKFFAVV